MPSADSENRPPSHFAVLVLCLALIGAGSMLYYHQGLFIPRALEARASGGLGNGYAFGNDFYQVWLSSREWLRHGRDPYSAAMTREIQTGLYGRPLDRAIPTDPIDQRQFPYPVFTDLLFWPTTEFSFGLVRVALLCLLLPLTAGAVLLWLRALDWRPGWRWVASILLLTLSSYPSLEALYAVQLGLVVAFLLAASIFALRSGRFLLAGILMALTTIKPQVTLLVIFYVSLWSLSDWRRRGSYCIGLLATLMVLVGGALILLPNWIYSWIHNLVAYHGYTTPQLLTEVLTKPLGARFAGPATLLLFAGSMIFAMILAWRNRAAAAASLEFGLTLSILLALTCITLLPGQAVYDHLALLPGILFLLRHRRKLLFAGLVPAVLGTVGAIVLFWPWTTALALIALRPLLPPSLFFSTAIFDLPIRTAASLPFAVFALLVYLRRITFATRPEPAGLEPDGEQLYFSPEDTGPPPVLKRSRLLMSRAPAAGHADAAAPSPSPRAQSAR
jgi:hypothetical protein